MCRNKKFIPTRETVVDSGSLRGMGKKNKRAPADGAPVYRRAPYRALYLSQGHSSPPSPPVQTEMIIYMVRRITPGFTPVDLMEKCIQIGR